MERWTKGAEEWWEPDRSNSQRCCQKGCVLFERQQDSPCCPSILKSGHAPRVADTYSGRSCCSPRGCRDMTQRLSNSNYGYHCKVKCVTCFLFQCSSIIFLYGNFLSKLLNHLNKVWCLITTLEVFFSLFLLSTKIRKPYCQLLFSKFQMLLHFKFLQFLKSLRLV